MQYKILVTIYLFSQRCVQRRQSHAAGLTSDRNALLAVSHGIMKIVFVDD
jgi:hypothetical protein